MIAHLVFWHLEYVHVVEALVSGRVYTVRHGTSTELNALAARQLPHEPMPVLAGRLSYRQKQLSKHLRELSDWSLNFPVKADGSFCTVSERIHQIESHIRGHAARLRRTARHHAPAEGVRLGTVDAFALPGARRYLLKIGSISSA